MAFTEYTPGEIFKMVNSPEGSDAVPRSVFRMTILHPAKGVLSFLSFTVPVNFPVVPPKTRPAATVINARILICEFSFQG